MRTAFKPLMEINQQVVQILSREIGVVNTLRFINQFTPGYGDYTEERRKLYKNVTVDEIVAEIRKDRRKA